MTLETDVTRIPGFAEPVRLVAALAKLSRNPTHNSSPSSFPPPLPTSPPPISSRLKGYSASCPILTPAHPTCPTHPAPPYPPYLASGLLSQSSPPFLSSCFFSSLFPVFPTLLPNLTLHITAACLGRLPCLGSVINENFHTRGLSRPPGWWGKHWHCGTPDQRLQSFNTSRNDVAPHTQK